MRRFVADYFCLILLVSVCFAQQQAKSVETYADKDAVAIYHALMPAPINGRALLLLETTRNAEMCKRVFSDERVSGEYAEALADFGRVNSQVWNLRSLLGNEGYSFITPQELDSLFHANVDKGWKKFYKHHPRAAGYIVFSAVGFSKDRTLAVVYTASACDSLCAHGGLEFLKLGSAGWKKVSPPFATCGWIS